MRKNKLLLLLALLLTAVTGAWAQDAKHLITATYREQTRSLEQPLPYATTIGELYVAVTGGQSFSDLISSMSSVGMPLTGITSRNTSIVSIGEFNGASTPVTVIADGETIINLIFGSYVQGIPVSATSPLYAYMKDGVKDADKWTVKVGEGQAQALPIGGLKGDGSETVTLQYNGRLKVKGVKAVKKAKPAAVTYIGTKSPTEAKAVGDIVFSDGSATAYTSGLTLTDEQKAAAVAVIFYAGSASDILGAKTLGVGLKNTNDETTKYLAFARNASGTAEGYNTNITAIQCTPSESGDGKAATATFTGDLDGSDNWTALCAAVNDEGTSGNYPAWEWVNAYATTANLTGEYASGWYLPTVAELCMLYRAKDTVNAALEKADGTIIVDNYYWSSSQSSSTNNKAWMVKFDSGKLMDTYKGNKWYVCGVRAFN